MQDPSSILDRANSAFLFNELDFKELTIVLAELHVLYATCTGIKAGDITDENIMLPSGKAVSPIRAAHCLLEHQRTRTFIRGIYKAILQLKKDFPGEQLHILYAGCGPYATLLTSFTRLFSSNEIRFHLLDVNAVSLTAVEQMYTALGLSDYVAEYICTDATTYQLPTDHTTHLIISETMLNALRKEPQVDIMLNLVPQLEEKALFVPEDITISAQLLSYRQEMEYLTTSQKPERLLLENIYSIGRASFKPHEETVVTIPSDAGSFTHLSLLTQITTFDTEQLGMNESSLNLPVRITDIPGNEGRSLSFKYRRGEDPVFEHKWL
ncbi:MAG: hypothetical protein J0I41_06400 [Filimonas sp.]|nr:hypothetical protein [Filimonas sp.]